ncbi:MAG TPA: POTRA domain-containing protein [Bacteroidota bacterium]|nr:POTRA domain-containing protein [Bacteroidota bacterium]
MKHPVIAIVALCCRLFAQPDTLQPMTGASYGIIDTIIVVGNEKTKESVILREMTLKPGMAATPELIEFDRSRIYSIGLFTRVDMTVVPFGEKNMLVVDVSERWYIIPLPLFGFRDGDPKKPYYGAGILHNNFRGMNQKLFGSIVFGYNPSLAFQYADPWIDRDHNLYFNGALSYFRIRNRSAVAVINTSNFDELHYDINVSLGKRFTLYTTAGINLGFQIVEVTEHRPGRTVNPEGSDKYFYGSINFTHDTRDLRDYTTQGTFIGAYITKYGFGETILSFTRIGADVRRFTPLPLDFTFAARAFGSIVSGGTIPTYARSYFGYGERIRGFFKDVFEGENIAGTSVEVRWPLLKPRVIHFSAIDLPQEFSVWRFGVSLELFADAGTTWFRGEKLSLKSVAAGYGGGIVFLLPYDVVIRTEYAWNRFGRGQFIFDLRSSF